MKFLLMSCCLILLASGGLFTQLEPSLASHTEGQTQTREKLCPSVSVSCSNDPKYDEPLEFTATVTGGDPNVTPTYDWEVAGGEILAGQGTAIIKVRAFEPKTITGTVRIGGFDHSCSRTASCSTPIHLRPSLPRKLHSFGIVPFDKLSDTLKHFGETLEQHPASLGYIVGYNGPQNIEGEPQKTMDSVREFLVEVIGLEKYRIITKRGGMTDALTIELWLIPQGSSLPEVKRTPNAGKQP